MSKVLEYLEARGISEDDVEAALDELLGNRFVATADRLTRKEEEFLQQHSGIDMAADDRAVAKAAARSVAAVTELIGAAVTTADLSRRLGVDASRVRHWASEGAIYAIRVGRHNRYPIWQFGPDGRRLTGLKAVLAALPEGLHPLAVQGFMTTPQPDYEIDDREVSAAEWLASGGDVGLVVEMADSLNYSH